MLTMVVVMLIMERILRIIMGTIMMIREIIMTIVMIG